MPEEYVSISNLNSPPYPRPFRAPELLFGPKEYDASKTDLWSLGCTLSHFFTPIRLFKESHSYSYYYSDGGEDEVGYGRGRG